MVAAVASLVSAAGASAHDEVWVEIKSPNFVVVSDAGEEKARRVARQLEKMRALLARVIGLVPERTAPLTVLAARSEGSLKALLPGYWEGEGHVSVGGRFVDDGEKSYIALRIEGSSRPDSRVVYHEYAHAALMGSVGRIPRWFNEGFATFFQNAEIGDDEVRWGMLPESSRALLRQTSRWVPLGPLLRETGGTPYSRDRRWVYFFYAESAALVHYLILGPPEARRGFEAMRSLLEAGTSDVEAVASALGDPVVLQEALERYVKGNVFSHYAAPVPLPEDPELTVRVLAPAEQLSIRGEFLVITRRPLDALPLLEQARALDPGLASASVSLARALLNEGRRGAAATVLDEFLARHPDDPRGYYLAFQALPPTQDDATESLREKRLRRAIELDPRHGKALVSLARFYDRRGIHLDEAVLLVRQARDLQPTSFDTRVLLARLLSRTGQRELAMAEERELLARGVTDPAALRPLVRGLTHEGRKAEAEQLLRAAFERSPDDVTILELLARWLWRWGRFDEAEALYRRELLAYPDDPYVLNQLGYMNADRGVKVEEALKMIDRAVAREPRNLDYIDSRGWALYRLGRRIEAEQVLRIAARTRQALILDHLGDVLRDRGALDQALSQWRLALENMDDPEDEDDETVALRRALGEKIKAAERDTRAGSPNFPR
jgi:tetratricopeptide (TPR) repeat protein